MQYKIGFCQFKPVFMDIKCNLERLNKLLCGVESDLLILPELAVSGYVFKDKKEVWRVAEDAIDGETVNFFRNLSRKNSTSYVVGFPEKAKNLSTSKQVVYNSCFLANPDGSYYVYRKTHLFNRETLFFEPGNSGLSVHTAKNGVKVGMMICFDWIFPETARTLVMRGAQIICHPSNLVLPWCQQAMITRSLENRVFTVTSNRVGKEINRDLEMSFTGQSQITDPQGKILRCLNDHEEGIRVVTVNPEEADNKMVTAYNHLLNDRRPDQYE